MPTEGLLSKYPLAGHLVFANGRYSTIQKLIFSVSRNSLDKPLIPFLENQAQMSLYIHHN